MDPWRTIGILEQFDSNLKAVFFPKTLRCQLSARIVRAIEEHSPVYSPTRKECRGNRWSVSIAAEEPLYAPRPSALRELGNWKQRITGTIAEGRAYHADRSWKRFVFLCQQHPTIKPCLDQLGPLIAFLVGEEDLWGRKEMPWSLHEIQLQMMIDHFSLRSCYRHAAPERIAALSSSISGPRKLALITEMRSLLDWPLMAFAMLQRSLDGSEASRYWPNLRDSIRAVFQQPDRLTFRKSWLQNAMKSAGAVTQSGEVISRRMAELLVDIEFGQGADSGRVDQKAIEISKWRNGVKLPSLTNIEKFWDVVARQCGVEGRQSATGKRFWTLSWFTTLLLEKHFGEIAVHFKNNSSEIRRYYERFFHYVELDLQD